MERVILVDLQDQELGSMEKMEAHKQGKLHRAFSVVLFNSKGEMLLQRRSAHKYHSSGLWTNTCCSHPQPGEPMKVAIQRKLKQEMGIDLLPDYAFKFHYRAELDNGLIENEIDHVYTGVFDGEPVSNPEEVESCKFENLATIRKKIFDKPEDYTAWFRLIIEHSEFNSISV